MKENQNKGTVGFIVFLLFAAMAVSGFATYQLSAVPSQVMEYFGLSESSFSAIMTASMVPSIFLSVVSGVLVDKFGVRKVCGIGVTISAVGILLRALTDSYAVCYVGMMLSGFTTMVLTANLAKIVASLVPPENAVKVVGLVMLGGTGSMAVSYITAPLFPSLKAAFWTVAVFAVLVAVFWWIVVREHHFSAGEAAHNSVSVRESLSVCLRSTNVWMTAICLLLLMGSATIITNFQVLALNKLHGLSEAEAGIYGTVLTIGAVAGTAVIPVVSAGMRNKRFFLLAINLVAGVAVYFVVSGLAPVRLVAAFLNGSLRSGVLTLMIAYPVMFPEIGRRYAGTAGGIIATFELMGAVLIPTYLVVPLCGSNIRAYFVCGTFIMIAAAFTGFMVPATFSRSGK